MTPETALLVELDLIPGQPERWQDQALCAEVDPELFFPEKGGTTLPAKRVCSGCEVRLECLQYALDRDERFGIWGGLSERERRRLKAGPVPRQPIVVKLPSTPLKPPTERQQAARRASIGKAREAKAAKRAAS